MEGIVISTVFKPQAGSLRQQAVNERRQVQGLNPEHIQGQGDSEVAAAE